MVTYLLFFIGDNCDNYYAFVAIAVADVRTRLAYCLVWVVCHRIRFCLIHGLHFRSITGDPKTVKYSSVSNLQQPFGFGVQLLV